MNNMGNYKFKKGDRVRGAKIDDVVYYGHAKYKVGDVGKVIHGNGRHCQIRFTKSKHAKNEAWWAKNSWLRLYKPLIDIE